MHGVRSLRGACCAGHCLLWQQDGAGTLGACKAVRYLAVNAVVAIAHCCRLCLTHSLGICHMDTHGGHEQLCYKNTPYNYIPMTHLLYAALFLSQSF